MCQEPSKSECHNIELILSQISLKGSFERLARVHKYLMKTGSEIEFGEPTGVSKLIHELIEHRDRKLGFSYQCI